MSFFNNDHLELMVAIRIWRPSYPVWNKVVFIATCKHVYIHNYFSFIV